MSEKLSPYLQEMFIEMAIQSMVLAQMYAQENPPVIGAMITHEIDIDHKYILKDVIGETAYAEYVDPETQEIIKNEFPYREIFEPNMVMEFAKQLVQQRLEKWNRES